MEFWTGSENLPISGFLIRALIVYLYIFIMVKWLGQRSMGSIDPIDFIFGVVIGDIVGEPISSGDIPLKGPLAGAGLIAILHWCLSFISLKMPRFRRVLEDEPLIIVSKGHILYKEMRKAKMTVESLLMDLRLQGAADLNEIDYAVLEANGQVSVIKKSDSDALTPKDMNIPLPDKGYPKVIVQDGHLISANLESIGTTSWFIKELQARGYPHYSDIFLLTIDEAGTWYVSTKNGSNDV